MIACKSGHAGTSKYGTSARTDVAMAVTARRAVVERMIAIGRRDNFGECWLLLAEDSKL